MITTINLPQGVTLDMVKISSGAFLIGSPQSEPDRYDDEGPQHEVRVPAFSMGRYPITQAQWRAVASLPQVERELDLDPFYFKGDNRPVEQVNWYDAMEFCARLSDYSGQIYTLPSEAQWEYACRAGTTTPFYFGDTITAALANYDGRYTYADGPKGEYRAQTTEVGSFPPNGFGLYDMHGNVWEWCMDVWHDSYNGVPTDGGAWVTKGDSSYRILRGGSWAYSPRYCRNGGRGYSSPDLRYGSLGVGLRVVSVPPRALG